VKILNSVSRIMALVGTALVLPMMVLIIADVFLRYVFSRPITGTAEIASLMLVCMVLGVAWCALEGRHIKVGILMDRFSPRVQTIADSITLLAGLGICVIATWRGFLASLWVLQSKEVASELLPLPVFPFHWIFFLGWVMLCLVLVLLMIQKVAEVVKG
jgi:TRAP-type C4-dicarboxylate transport system permease small subunit